MRIQSDLTDEAVLAELGERITRTRLEHNLSQQELGEEAGVGRRTAQRLEAGESVQLVSLLRVLRVLGLMDSLDRLVPEPVPSPIERLKLRGRERQRAAGRHGHPAPPQEQGERKPWTWGDESPGQG